ncbi:leucine-rich repeat protein 1 isoform X1 [Pieris napi]|uniref:leucine-rich repeat protein 1 isoform X1 n=2 Tax=Pieris napi TaxID=78633 RepID=UPI001FBA22B7|nr:leucine-rich repeat protein 1 isoform X1 [Pieris napi]
MKLICKIEVVNRAHNNLNIRSNGKYIKSTLALSKEPKNSTEYCMFHFSSVNKSGIKYKVKCIKQVFVKCLNEGKITIRFSEPPHDLCVKSEVLQLKSFLNLLKSCITGNVKNLKVSNLSSVGVTALDNAPTKLTILTRNDIPSKGFPRTLESLYMAGLKLCNFRRDILVLRRLTVLDLSNNEIEKIPYEFARMPNLNELYLTNNSLGTLESVDWRWLLGPQITKTLKLLDLCGNKLKVLPRNIWKLHNLVTLKLDNNLLERLPASLGRMRKLRYLTLSHNYLQYLPCSVMQCRLDQLDISHNNLQNPETLQKPISLQWDFCVGRLLDIAAKVVLRNNMYYAPNVIPFTLVETLDGANTCVCGKPVLNNVFLIKQFDSRDCFSTVTVINNNVNSAINFQCYFCSSKCLRVNNF